MNKRKLIIGVVALALVAGGVAAALWSATGSGSGTAKALTAQTVTVNATTGTADLYPGFAGGDVFFTLTNNNPYAIQFTTLTAASVTGTSSGACTSANVGINTIPITGLTLNAPANTTSGTLSIPDVVNMISGAPDACQGVEFTISLTLTGSQV